MCSEHKSSGCEVVICIPGKTMQFGPMEVLVRRLNALACALVLLGFPIATRAEIVTNSLVQTTAMTTVTHAIVPLRNNLDDRHPIRPGDKLAFRVDEDKEEAKQLVVTDSGE